MKRVKTPTVIQMEAVECGAACLAIILEYFGRHVPLAQLRLDCGVSRDGSNALNMIKAAAGYGLSGKGFRKTADELRSIQVPFVVLWEGNHFLVVEGFSKDKVFLNDPALGPRTVTHEEFAQSYFDIALVFEKTKDFKKGGLAEPLWLGIYKRVKNVRMALFYIFLAGVCLLLPGLALPAFIRIFVDNVLVQYSSGPASLLMGGILLMAALGGLLIWLQSYFLSRLKSRLDIQFSSHFLWHLLRLPVSFYTQRYAGEIAFRTTLNEKVASQLTGGLATTFIDLLLIIFYGIVMLSYDLFLGGIAFLAALVNSVVFYWIQKSRTDSYARLQQETGKWLSSALGALQQMETIKATGLESDFFARFGGFYAKTINAEQEISKKDAFLSVVPTATQAFALAIVLIFGSLKVMDGKLSFGMLISIQTLLLAFLTPITRFVNFGQTLQQIKTDLGRLDDVLKYKIDPVYSYSRENEGEANKLEGTVEFRNVTFGYSRLAEPLLKNFSFKIKPGQRLALVGPSGSGKSTIAKLASGLFLPWEGEILFDGKSLKEIPASTFYQSFGYVDQQIFLFSGTVKNNITLWNRAVSEDIVIQAAMDAGIHEEIMLRPSGYENVLLEHGRNLSGGQRQRLEIARALLYSPSVLIMDEATSALDSETEKTISENIQRRGCSAIIVAHRLSTIRDCDEIIVLDKGEVVQRGAHDELIRHPGLYLDLMESST